MSDGTLEDYFQCLKQMLTAKRPKAACITGNTSKGRPVPDIMQIVEVELKTKGLGKTWTSKISLELKPKKLESVDIFEARLGDVEEEARQLRREPPSTTVEGESHRVPSATELEVISSVKSGGLRWKPLRSECFTIQQDGSVRTLTAGTFMVTFQLSCALPVSPPSSPLPPQVPPLKAKDDDTCVIVEGAGFAVVNGVYEPTGREVDGSPTYARTHNGEGFTIARSWSTDGKETASHFWKISQVSKFSSDKELYRSVPQGSPPELPGLKWITSGCISQAPAPTVRLFATATASPSGTDAVTASEASVGSKASATTPSLELWCGSELVFQHSEFKLTTEKKTLFLSWPLRLVEGALLTINVKSMGVHAGSKMVLMPLAA